MRINNAIRILFGNFKLSYKSLLYRLIWFVVVVVAAYFTVSATLNPVLSNECFSNLASSVKSATTEFFSGKLNGEFVADISVCVEKCLDVIKQSEVDLFSVLIEIFAFVFIFKFFANVSNVAVCGLVNDYMSSLIHRSYTAELLTDMWKKLVFALLYTAVDTVLQIIIVLITYLTFILFNSVFGFFAYTVCIAVLWVLIAVKYTVTLEFLPLFVCEKKRIGYAFVHTFKNAFKGFGGTLINNITAVILIYMFNLGFGVLSFGASLIITIPVSCIFFESLKLCLYYNLKTKKYYLDFDHIVVPKELREHDEQLLSGIEI